LTVEINHGVYANVVDDVHVNGEVDLAIYHPKNCRIGERTRCCPGDKISIDIAICASLDIDSRTPDFAKRAFCYSPVVACCDDSRKSATLYKVVLHVNRQIFHAPVIPGTKQKIARRHPGNLQDGRSAPFAHQMNIRRYM